MVTPVESEPVRLRTKNAELRVGVEARAQENALLLQMISDVISTLKLDRVLRHIVEHLVAAFGCHAAFVYLWEPERARAAPRTYTPTAQPNNGCLRGPADPAGQTLAAWPRPATPSKSQSNAGSLSAW